VQIEKASRYGGRRFPGRIRDFSNHSVFNQMQLGHFYPAVAIVLLEIGRGSSKMSCKEAIRMVCEYLEGRLSPPVNVAVRHHLDQCKNCNMVMEAAKNTLEVYFDGVRQEETHSNARVA
jgi:hypothetical protein